MLVFNDDFSLINANELNSNCITRLPVDGTNVYIANPAMPDYYDAIFAFNREEPRHMALFNRGLLFATPELAREAAEFMCQALNNA